MTEKKMQNNIKGSLMLCIAALIWGLAFVAQTDAGDKVPPFMFNGIRSIIAAVFLLAVGSIVRFGEGTKFLPKEKNDRKRLFIAGVVCGILLFAATNFQQFGVTVYPDGVAAEARGGFLTSLYIIIVPVLSIVMKKKTSSCVWLAAGIAIFGIFLLCMGGNSYGFHIGDLLIMLCAIFLSLHIMAISILGNGVNGVKLSIVQFIVCGTVSLVISFITETVEFGNIISALPQILYVGIFSSGVAYTLQIIGQKYAEPSVATLSMSLESVFAALGGWLISGNSLGAKEIVGCVLVFLAVLIAQIDLKNLFCVKHN